MNIVVVGGGFAGVKTALELSKRHIGKITLISNEDYFLHHATLYATATGRNFAESVLPLAVLFQDAPNVTVVKDTMTALDTKRKLVIGEKAQYHYDAVVIAIGSVTTYFGINGMKEHSFGIKSLAEVKAFIDHIHHELVEKQLDRDYVIIGCGPTGIELAGALQVHLNSLVKLYNLKGAKPKVTLVEAAPRILPRSSVTASKKVSAQLKKMGVKILTNHKVEGLSETELIVDGKPIPTKTAIWTSGVANNPFFAAHADQFPLAKNGRVDVNQYLEALPGVYVIGDNNTVKYSGMAWPALDQAEFVADHLARVATKRHFKAFRPKQPPSGVPVGDDWAYVEWKGIYASGKLGAWIRRRMELYGYKQLAKKPLALAAWRAHDIPEIDL